MNTEVADEGSEDARISPRLLALAVFFITGLLLSNLTAGKLIVVGGRVLQAADLLFPLTYVLGDVLAEVYGLARARRVIWLGFACNALSVAVFALTVWLPHPDFWTNQAAYEAVFSVAPRILLGSLIGYLLGELSNAALLVRLKALTRGRALWIRTIASSVVGEALDTLAFNLIAFLGLLPFQAFLQMVAFQYVWKLGYEIILTPLTYAAVGWLKKKGE